MKTQEYIDAQEAYINRLKSMRQREKEHLSDVDFALFASRFDRLISKAETELVCARLTHDATCNLHVVELMPNAKSMSSKSMSFCESLYPGIYASICDYQNVLQHYAMGPISAIQHPETYPGQFFLNSVAVRNDEGTFRYSSQFATALPV